ncbi:hypothetical protein SNEBB_007149 [Seison nebaliae]|nr:hypothetical protein SNEBB_007149 [Seison nebaliae]
MNQKQCSNSSIPSPPILPENLLHSLLTHNNHTQLTLDDYKNMSSNTSPTSPTNYTGNQSINESVNESISDNSNSLQSFRTSNNEDDGKMNYNCNQFTKKKEIDRNERMRDNAPKHSFLIFIILFLIISIMKDHSIGKRFIISIRRPSSFEPIEFLRLINSNIYQLFLLKEFDEIVFIKISPEINEWKKTDKYRFSLTILICNEENMKIIDELTFLFIRRFDKLIDDFQLFTPKFDSLFLYERDSCLMNVRNRCRSQMSNEQFLTVKLYGNSATNCSDGMFQSIIFPNNDSQCLQPTPLNTSDKNWCDDVDLLTICADIYVAIWCPNRCKLKSIL